METQIHMESITLILLLKGFLSVIYIFAYGLKYAYGLRYMNIFIANDSIILFFNKDQ